MIKTQVREYIYTNPSRCSPRCVLLYISSWDLFTMAMKQWKYSAARPSHGRIVSYRASPPESPHASIFRFGREVDRFALQGYGSAQASKEAKFLVKTNLTPLNQGNC